MLSNLTTFAVILAVLAALAWYSVPEVTTPCCQNETHLLRYGETVYCPVRGS
jgi:hypothetical protein